MRGAYLDYAMSVITSRALPDVRDGLKPVQRRILYAMHELGIRANTQYKKSARIIGEVLGKYHPHGDGPVYEAMVRMAQPFSLRYPLINGQGNFGSVDGDPPAAMRYTEARLSAIAEEMLTDIDKETIDYTPNFDDSLNEPAILPATLPNLLINGASGIAVGMATNIPPHNLSEIVNAMTMALDLYEKCIDKGVPFGLLWPRVMNTPLATSELAAALKSVPDELRPTIENEAAKLAKRPNNRLRTEAFQTVIDQMIDITPDQLMKYVRGPDFPTAGIVQGVEGIKTAYATGHGKIVVSGRVTTEETRLGRYQIVITELPFQVNKANLIEKIADLVRAKRIDGVSDLRDESDRSGMRIVVELKRDAMPPKVINQLYRHTSLRSNFSFNMLALVDGQPRLLTLKSMIVHHLNWRHTVITRRTIFDLNKAKQRAHVLEGLKIALDNLDAVIRTIRQSSNADTARGQLMTRFKLTEIQAQAVLDMQLRRLAALERNRILEEYSEILKLIAKLEDILENPEKILRMVRDDLLALKKRYGDERRTNIFARELAEFREEDLIPEADVIVVVSGKDYAKRLPKDSYRVHNRGAKGLMTTLTRQDDAVQHLLVTNTHDHVMFFTNQGRVYHARAFELPESTRGGRGTPLVNLIRILPEETVTAVVNVPSFDLAEHFVLVSRQGKIKRVALSGFASVRANGLLAMALNEGDELIKVHTTSGMDHIIVLTENGQALRMSESDIRLSARASGGVRSISLEGDDRVIGSEVVRPKGEILVVSQQGFAKRTSVTGFRLQQRGGKGVIAGTINDKTGLIAAVSGVTVKDEIFVISREGLVVRTAVQGVSKQGRTSMGVKLMNVAPGDEIVGVSILRADQQVTAGGVSGKDRRRGKKPRSS